MSKIFRYVVALQKFLFTVLQRTAHNNFFARLVPKDLYTHSEVSKRVRKRGTLLQEVASSFEKRATTYTASVRSSDYRE